MAVGAGAIVTTLAGARGAARRGAAIGRQVAIGIVRSDRGAPTDAMADELSAGIAETA